MYCHFELYVFISFVACFSVVAAPWLASAHCSPSHGSDCVDQLMLS